MIHELDIFGVYFAPFVGDLCRAAIIFFFLRWILAKTNLFSHVWHAALFELCLFVGVLTATVYFI